jgi:hypothetical protein
MPGVSIIHRCDACGKFHDDEVYCEGDGDEGDYADDRDE